GRRLLRQSTSDGRRAAGYQRTDPPPAGDRRMKARWLAAAALLFSSPTLADTLIDNVNGISVDRNGTVTRFEAILIDDEGKVREIVPRGERAPRADYREDGRGRTVIPGITDSPVHVMGLGLRLRTVALANARTLAEAEQQIRPAA